MLLTTADGEPFATDVASYSYRPAINDITNRILLQRKSNRPLFKDGAIYIPIRPICDTLGIALAGQRERINRDPVLSEAVTSVSVILTVSEPEP